MIYVDYKKLKTYLQFIKQGGAESDKLQSESIDL